MIIDTHPSETATAIGTSPWQVRLTVLWRDEELPVPITDETRALALGLGVRISARPGSCLAYFSIDAASVRTAVERALSTWSTVVAESGMPKWEIVSFAVDQVDPHDTLIG